MRCILNREYSSFKQLPLPAVESDYKKILKTNVLKLDELRVLIERMFDFPHHYPEKNSTEMPVKTMQISFFPLAPNNFLLIF